MELQRKIHLLGLKSQCKQKPVNKVKPKFKVGEWIIHQGTDKIYQVVACIDNQYQLKYDNNYTVQKCADVDICARLWDITKDAKDGDILDANGAPFIYKKHDKDYVYFYCGINLAGTFIEADEIDTWNNNYKVYPATKEQRDLLFQKMKEAGYEWDAERKELKKIEKSVWSEEDEKMIDNIIDYMMPMPIFFESTKGKSSKEYIKEFIKEATDWLKHLKDRYTWKPSDEQMTQLKKYCPDNRPLTSLYEQLKKLKG